MSSLLRLFLLAAITVAVGFALVTRRKPSTAPTLRELPAESLSAISQFNETNSTASAEDFDYVATGAPYRIAGMMTDSDQVDNRFEGAEASRHETISRCPVPEYSLAEPSRFSHAGDFLRDSGVASPNQQMANDIASALKRLKLAHYEIDIDVRNGEVSLNGNVVTAEQRTAVEEVVTGIEGVRRVLNRLRTADEKPPAAEEVPAGDDFQSLLWPPD